MHATPTRHVVVIGHGMVNHRFVEALRARDTAGAWRVTILSEELDPAYDRVALSSYIKTWDRAAMAMPGNTYPDDPAVSTYLGARATRIDTAARRILLDSDDPCAPSTLDYDAVVIGTGSYPFIPPISGSDAPGCHVYRTLDDLDGLRRDAEAALARNPEASGVVVGGGLLGLEAAKALQELGLRAHVVEFAPRLMPLQVDEAGGELLRTKIEALGIQVHTGVGTSAVTRREDADIAAGQAALEIELSDGQTIDAELLVFSAGVRPRDQVARDSEIEVGPRGGIITDSACRTGAPDVYAVGEVAAVEGRCYGLVGPGNVMAEVVVDRLLGGDATFPGADMSTKLKLLGVDVASFGDAMAATAGALSVVVNDPIGGTYSKLVLSDDAKTLLGGIFVGDASQYGLLRPLVGSELPGDPVALIAPSGGDGGGSGGGAGAGGLGVGILPADAQICSCNNVSKGQIVEAIHEQGCADVPAVKACTNAGTSCGSCVPLLKQILESEGVEQSRAICEHFPRSRAEMFHVVNSTGIRTFSELIATYGQGTGCDLCKPTIASILASTSSEHILDGERAGMQDTNDRFLANLQRNGTYSVVPRMPGGEVTAQQLITIGEVARDFDLYVKVTGGQRIDMFGARLEQLPQIWSRLVAAGMESGQAYGKSLRTVKSCVGSSWCRYGQQDSVAMAVRLELRYRGLRSPHKFKLGVSGCARECAEARSKDIGVIATEKGWNLYVGGNGGATPAHAQLLAGDLDDETLVRYIDRFVMFYVRNADRLQRTAPWVESLEGGMAYLKSVICEDSLGVAASLEAAMAAHVDGYSCEWKAVLDDPEKLARFVSFINAPDAPDPLVQFSEEGGRKVPVVLGEPGFPPRAAERALLAAGRSAGGGA